MDGKGRRREVRTSATRGQGARIKRGEGGRRDVKPARRGHSPHTGRGRGRHLGRDPYSADSDWWVDAGAHREHRGEASLGQRWAGGQRDPKLRTGKGLELETGERSVGGAEAPRARSG